MNSEQIRESLRSYPKNSIIEFTLKSGKKRIGYYTDIRKVGIETFVRIGIFTDSTPGGSLTINSIESFRVLDLGEKPEPVPVIIIAGEIQFLRWLEEETETGWYVTSEKNYYDDREFFSKKDFQMYYLSKLEEKN